MRALSNRQWLVIGGAAALACAAAGLAVDDAIRAEQEKAEDCERFLPLIRSLPGAAVAGTPQRCIEERSTMVKNVGGMNNDGCLHWDREDTRPLPAHCYQTVTYNVVHVHGAAGTVDLLEPTAVVLADGGERDLGFPAEVLPPPRTTP